VPTSFLTRFNTLNLSNLTSSYQQLRQQIKVSSSIKIPSEKFFSL
jgi:hypothetical protein